MKERGIGSQNGQNELTPIQSGLTQKPDNPTLDTGDIFMADGPTNPEGEQPPVNPQDRAREAWGRVNEGKAVPLAERRTQDMLIEKGIMPMAGAEDFNPENIQRILADKVKGVPLNDTDQETLRIFDESIHQNPLGFTRKFTDLIDGMPAGVGKQYMDIQGRAIAEGVFERISGDLPPSSQGYWKREIDRVLKISSVGDAADGLDSLIERMLAKHREYTRQPTQRRPLRGVGKPPETPPTGPTPEGGEGEPEEVSPAPSRQPAQEEAIEPQERVEDLKRRFFQQRELQ